jgi:hypothetical protein
MNQTATDEQYRELCALCRSGKLFQVQDWFESGKPTEPPVVNPRMTPITISIDKGFHSLTELLLCQGVSPTGKPLRKAVARRKFEIVKLFFDYGADVHSVRFEEAVESGHPEIIKWFIERGADFVTGHPIADGLINHTRPMLGVYKSFIDRHPDLKFQAEIALRSFCRDDTMRGVSLMLWLGADPRVKVPEWKGRDTGEEYWDTSLFEAIWNGHVDVARRIGVQPERDDLRCVSESMTSVGD